MIDDGSDDSTRDILEENYADNAQIRLLFEDNHGNAFARNVGLRSVRGEYIAFLDADDYYDLNFIETSIETLKQTESDIVVCDYARFSGDIDVDNQRTVTGIEFQNAYTAVWNKVYRTSIWKDIFFPEGMIIEDLQVSVLLILKSGRVSKNDLALYHYRRNEESITKNKKYTGTHVQIVESLTMLWNWLNEYKCLPEDLTELQLFFNQQIFTHCVFSIMFEPDHVKNMQSSERIISFLRMCNMNWFQTTSIKYSQRFLIQIKDTIIIKLIAIKWFEAAKLLVRLLSR